MVEKVSRVDKTITHAYIIPHACSGEVVFQTGEHMANDIDRIVKLEVAHLFEVRLYGVYEKGTLVKADICDCP